MLSRSGPRPACHRAARATDRVASRSANRDEGLAHGGQEGGVDTAAPGLRRLRAEAPALIAVYPKI